MASALPTKVGYTRLGSSGLKVSKIILGCMSYGNTSWNGGWCHGEEESLKHFQAAWEMGINTWDTANTYGNGDSERVIGKAVKQLGIPRDELVLLTKVFYPVKPSTNEVIGTTNLSGLSRKHIFDSVKASLERLQMDYIDVLQCHSWDANTPIEETMDALHDVVKLGLVRYIGMSTCSGWQLHAMQNYAKSRNQTAFISMQPFHSAIYREDENELFNVCKLFGLGVIPWSPLARGFLTKPFADTAKTLRAEKDPYLGFMTDGSQEMSNNVNAAVEKVAKERGYSMAQVALAWSLSNPVVTAPIVGSTRIESLRELVQATHIELPKEDIESISKAYRPRFKFA